jgi:hypothetical protein
MWLGLIPGLIFVLALCSRIAGGGANPAARPTKPLPLLAGAKGLYRAPRLSEPEETKGVVIKKDSAR